MDMCNCNKDCIISKEIIQDIPILFIRHNDNKVKPIIFLFHKLLCDKNSELPLAYELAQHGYFVIIFDICGHGERNILPVNKYDFQHIFRDAYKTAANINDVLNYLKVNDYPNVCINNVGVVGLSFGGTIALISGYMVNEVKYVASIIGTCNLQYIIENKTLESFKPFSLTKPVMDYDEAQVEMEEIDPIKHYNSNNLKPMLFLDGKLDMTVPYREKLVFYDELKTLFDNNGQLEDLTFKVYSNAGHQITTQMIETLIQWLHQVA